MQAADQCSEWDLAARHIPPSDVRTGGSAKVILLK